MRVRPRARQARWTTVVPVLAPTLAALWIDRITPIPRRLAVPLVEGIAHPVLADTSKAQALFPDIHPMHYKQAVERALARMNGR